MGSGKTTIGKSLSQRLEMGFADVDAIIEKKVGLSISEIFEKKGEKAFREEEEKESKEILKKTNLVIALGGGAFINENIRNEIKKSSFSVWLDLDVEILARLRSNDISMTINMKDKVAVVTGGSSGIGKAAAAAFLREGAKVAICGRSQDRLDEAAAALSSIAGADSVFPHTCDVLDEAAVEAFAAAAVERFGAVDL